MSDKRETLSIKAPSAAKQRIRDLLAESDLVHLSAQPQFLRTLFTIFELAGMFTGNYQPDGRNHAFAEGR
ncbi:MAG: hypothetical protein ACJ8FS_16595, partial [Sphingomicrobium sp.]